MSFDQLQVKVCVLEDLIQLSQIYPHCTSYSSKHFNFPLQHVPCHLILSTLIPSIKSWSSLSLSLFKYLTLLLFSSSPSPYLNFISSRERCRAPESDGGFTTSLSCQEPSRHELYGSWNIDSWRCLTWSQGTLPSLSIPLSLCLLAVHTNTNTLVIGCDLFYTIY